MSALVLAQLDNGDLSLGVVITEADRDKLIEGETILIPLTPEGQAYLETKARSIFLLPCEIDELRTHAGGCCVLNEMKSH